MAYAFLNQSYVDSGNSRYSSLDGVLFSKDKTALLCYPAARLGESYLLSTNVKSIGAYAFDGVKHLKKILYEGSSAKYKSISVGAGNIMYSNMKVTYNYVAAK